MKTHTAVITVLLGCVVGVMSAHHGDPYWIKECWDHGDGHFNNPLCDLLTEPTISTTTPTTTTTTTEPTTTTTTEPTTTTTEATTTTTTQPPTTTPRSCTYLMYNESNIKNTNYGEGKQIGVQLRNETVHVINSLDACKTTCENSLLQDNFECWAFTYNPAEKCYMYYYDRPLMYIPNNIPVNGTTLFLKRCSDSVLYVTTSTSTESQSTESQSTESQSTDLTMSQSTSTVTQPLSTGSQLMVNKTTATPEPTSTTTASFIPSTTTAGGSVNPTTGVVPVGPVQIDKNTFRINGVPSPVAGTCYFFNKTHNLGDSWKDTCRYNCTCTNTASNSATCTDICPIYTQIPSNCKLVKNQGDCCQSVNCTGPTQAPSVSGNCTDRNDSCLIYEDSSCREPFVQWAKYFCALRCDFCPGQAYPCEDSISYCERYDLDDACLNYKGWARMNCRKSCSMCNVPGWNPFGVNRVTVAPQTSTAGTTSIIATGFAPNNTVGRY